MLASRLVWCSSLVSGLALLGCDGSSGGGATGDPGAGGSGASTGSNGGGGSTGDGGSGAGGSASGGGGQGGAPSGLVPMFVAQGHVGRTLVSCDDGVSWIADQSDDDAVVCFVDGVDCDHAAGAANGMAWGHGTFFATFGWGTPGSVRRSQDGVVWEAVIEGTTFGGMAFGQERALAGSRDPRVSLDDGATWTELAQVEMDVYNVREVAFVPHAEGRFLLVGSDGDVEDVALSDDGGDSWYAPETLPASCGISFYASGGTAYGDGVLLVADGSGTACRSTDGGASWEAVQMPSSFESHLLWTGSEFVAWAQGTRLASSDGLAWTTTETTPPSLVLGPVARSDAGTFVGVKGGWNQWYEAQRFYRSSDGVTWTEVPAGSFGGGHPIRDIQFGWGSPSAACPAR